MPLAQKIGGKEEEKGYLESVGGYLGAAYGVAGGAVRTVYDSAGNVVRGWDLASPQVSAIISGVRD